MRKILLSVVVTAPHGIAACAYLNEIRIAGDMGKTHIIVADASEEYEDQSSSDLLHLSYPNRGIQGLIREGIAASIGDWILITEDHCRPDPDVVSEYVRLMVQYPEIDLFSGTVKNATSTSVWSTATYVIGLGAFSPYANQAPTDASNANMLIRKAAIEEGELQHDGGLLNLTVPRLIRSGKYMHCLSAKVDHVVPLKPSETVGFICHCTLDAHHESRLLRKQKKSTAHSVVTSVMRFVGHIAFVPLRVVRLFHGTGYLNMRHFLCVSAISVGLAFVVLGADLKRTLKQS